MNSYFTEIDNQIETVEMFAYAIEFPTKMDISGSCQAGASMSMHCCFDVVALLAMRRVRQQGCWQTQLISWINCRN